ncbi:hypothetical protein EON63_11475 [archaeon]|nr:MAG: hypothetical protein EON63_11475 [archaeon]
MSTIHANITYIYIDTNTFLTHTLTSYRVFGESVDNTHVYTHSTQPLVQIACQGGYATAMVYGQTGSGKVSGLWCMVYGT